MDLPDRDKLIMERVAYIGVMALVFAAICLLDDWANLSVEKFAAMALVITSYAAIEWVFAVAEPFVGVASDRRMRKGLRQSMKLALVFLAIYATIKWALWAGIWGLAWGIVATVACVAILLAVRSTVRARRRIQRLIKWRAARGY